MIKQRFDSEKRLKLEIEQQIANYNNSLSQIYNKLNSLQDQIDEIRAYEKRRFDALESRMQAIESKTSVKNTELQFAIDDLYKLSRDTASHGMNMSSALASTNNKVENCELAKSSLHADLEALKEKIKELEKQHKYSHEGYSHRTYELEQKTKTELKRFKYEMLNLPSESEKVRQDLLAVIDTHKVDVESLMFELKVWKKDQFITEKKIENIYTLIKRLEEKLA